MYNVVFENDNGSKYYFGAKGTTVFDMDLGDGVPTEIGTSQGFSQVGETVQNRNVLGRSISVSGVVYGNVKERKATMRRIMNPFASGRLVFEGKYFARVFVKHSPSFSSVKNDGRFTMQFYSPYPFFKSIQTKTVEIGSIRPLFSFPVNYEIPHKFGERGSARYKNVTNESDVKVPFSIRISTTGISENISITNLVTFKSLKLNGTINSGDVIEIGRTEDGVLFAELTSNGTKTDIISWVDEKTNLYELDVGDNLISATDSGDGATLTVKITYNPVVVALYES